jgi:hypothetical protein
MRYINFAKEKVNMAIIDTSKIENYENMSAEEKVAALEAFEFAPPEPASSPDVDNLKNLLSRANGEAASWKKKFHDKLSDEEKKEANRAEELESLRNELQTYKTAERINGYKARLLEIGYDADTADSLAKSLPEGVGDSFFDTQKMFYATRQQKIQEDLLKGQSGLSAGSTPKPEDPAKKLAEAFRKGMGL